MDFIGNFKQWINPEWVDYLLTHDGTARPSTSSENPNTEEFRLAPTVGYDLTQTWWYHYCNTSCPLIITPPFSTDKKYIWWFIKLKPGGMMPVHRDPHVTADDDKHNCTRYWMPLQDYTPGHMFVYNDMFMTNYKAGDLWVYTNANEIHGCANISYSPRLTFQITTYDTPSEN